MLPNKVQTGRDYIRNINHYLGTKGYPAICADQGALDDIKAMDEVSGYISGAVIVSGERSLSRCAKTSFAQTHIRTGNAPGTKKAAPGNRAAFNQKN